MLAEAQVSGGLYSTIVQRRADAPRVGAAPTASEMETVPLKKLAALSGVKTEFIYDAVALVPKHLGTSAKSEVSILLHLHGLSNVGPNYEKMLGKEGLIPSEYDMAAQLQTFSAARPSAPLIALLPVGQTLPKRGTVDFGDFDTTTLVNETVTQLVGMNKLPAGSTAGSVILSAHSAGGFYARNAASQKTSAKQVAGMLAFESIHDADIGKYESFLKGKIEDDIKEVHRLGPPASTASAKAEAAFREQSQYLREHGFRFVGFAGLVNYKSRFHRLRVAIFGEKGKKGWIDDQHELRSAAASHYPQIRELFEANYQIHELPKEEADHFKVLAGKPGHGRLEEALETLPTTAGQAVRKPGVEHRAEAPDKATTRAIPTTAAELLVASAVALGRAGKASARPAGGTLLHQEDLQAALANRSKNAKLNERFSQAEAAVAGAQEGPSRIAASQKEAHALVRLIEVQFILDPKRSALDLLSSERAKHWKTFAWEEGDYPGNAGPHQKAATAMMLEMTEVRAERRPNTGSAAVMVKDERTPERWDYIDKQSPPVPGESGQRLNKEAGESFAKMREAAKADGVKLYVLDGYRPHKIAEARAKKRKNPQAVASFSSHSLGLAADLEMSAGKQQFLETTTTPMQNVADMRAAPAHKWMVLRGEEYGWYPFGNEPWHWEYNPSGFKDRFWSAAPASIKPDAQTTKKATPAAASKETAKAKSASVAAPAAKATGVATDKKLSGPDWFKQYPGSDNLDDLVEPFKGNARSFIAMLRANHATVSISATYRPPQRAWLMHWAWEIAKGNQPYSKVGSIENPYNIAIEWDHGNEKSTRAAAAAMVKKYKMAHHAALKSRHTERHAIDITIDSLPSVLKVDGKDHSVGDEPATENKALRRLSRSLYHVVKNPGDPPHWSTDGL
jgi:D-alanyl-D-alanine dipeptidase